jgi:hypothetical protein
MNQIIESLLSPYWWFSAVVMAIIVNLLSSYFKPWMDKWWAMRSEKRSVKIAEREKKFEEEVDALSRSYQLLMIEGQRLVSAEITSLGGLFLMSFLLLLSMWIKFSPLKETTLNELVQIAVSVCIFFGSIVLVVLQKREIDLHDRVSAARKKYKTALE